MFQGKHQKDPHSHERGAEKSPIPGTEDPPSVVKKSSFVGPTQAQRNKGSRI